MNAPPPPAVAASDASASGFAPPSAAAPSQSPSAPVPADAAAIQRLLAARGLQPGDYQAKVVAQLLEFQNRYCREILEQAQEYCLHRDSGNGKAFIDVDDIELAVQSHLSHSFVSPPARELQFSLAAARNSVPLPIVPTKEGVHLPPERFTLMQPNYRIKPASANKPTHEHKSHS